MNIEALLCAEHRSRLRVLQARFHPDGTKLSHERIREENNTVSERDERPQSALQGGEGWRLLEQSPAELTRGERVRQKLK